MHIMNRIRSDCYLRSVKYIEDIGVFTSTPTFSSIPVARYILGIYAALPIQHVILGERPYRTDIFNAVSSAMSYDIDKEPYGTPSTNALAQDISLQHDISHAEVEAWFRDSWQYVKHGVVLLNVCFQHSFMDQQSLRERVRLERYVMDLITMSIYAGGGPVHIYAMGNPAQFSASNIRSSYSGDKKMVKIHKSINPAALSHKKGDRRSHLCTLGSPSVSKLLYRLIIDTRKSWKLVTSEDYIAMSTGPPNDKARLAAAGTTMANEFEKVEEYFKKGGSYKGMSTEEEVFRKAKEATREFVMALSSAKIGLLFASLNEPPAAAKYAFGTTKTAYPKRFIPGTASEVSSNTRASVQNVGFHDDSGAEGESSNVTSIKTPATSTPPSRAPPRSVTQSVTSRRVIHEGFADEDSPDEAMSPPPSVNVVPVMSTLADQNITNEEAEDMSYLSDFVEATEDFIIPNILKEEINECTRTKRAAGEYALSAIGMIREVRKDTRQRSIMNALGYENGIVDVPSIAYQWVLKHATN